MAQEWAPCRLLNVPGTHHSPWRGVQHFGWNVWSRISVGSRADRPGEAPCRVTGLGFLSASRRPRASQQCRAQLVTLGWVHWSGRQNCTSVAPFLIQDLELPVGGTEKNLASECQLTWVSLGFLCCVCSRSAKGRVLGTALGGILMDLEHLPCVGSMT